MKYEDKVQVFIQLLHEKGNKRLAAIAAHKKFGLNAADSAGGISSDEAAFIEACEQVFMEN